MHVTLSTTNKKKQKMGDCGLNCDFNAGVIDSFYRQTYQEREKQQKKDPNYQKMMARIRRTHICSICQKYPGDADYLFGTKINGNYKCFDCY